MVPDGCPRSASASTARATARWLASSPTAPRVRPNGWATNTASEGRACRVIEGAWVMETVAMPAWSRPRCSSPTDCWQTGQAGTSRARSTCWDQAGHHGRHHPLQDVQRSGDVAHGRGGDRADRSGLGQPQQRADREHHLRVLAGPLRVVAPVGEPHLAGRDRDVPDLTDGACRLVEGAGRAVIVDRGVVEPATRRFVRLASGGHRISAARRTRSSPRLAGIWHPKPRPRCRSLTLHVRTSIYRWRAGRSRALSAGRQPFVGHKRRAAARPPPGGRFSIMLR